jgi:4-hydroxybenzoate polyprenyltransferase/phosphoserine phosphatase
MLAATSTQTPRHLGVEPPLCVDLDGTLIAGDLLWEAVLALLRQRPWLLLMLPLWLLRGKAHLKEQLAVCVRLAPETLPYHTAVLDFLRRERERGRWLVLATASNWRLARAVADHLGLFDEVLASDLTTNLKGRSKLAALQRRYGATRFDYIGDATADLPVWAAARRAYVVKPSQRLLKRAQARCTPEVLAEPAANPARSLFRLLRPHQWAKNLLLLVPLVGAHAVTDSTRLLAVLVGLAAFSLCASAVYVLNDLTDLEADRRHPTKCRRPLASGALSIRSGLVLFALLFSVSFAVSAVWLPPAFTGLLALYAVLTTAYSLRLKREPILDTFVLAGLYLHRIVAGGVAAGVPVSGWLMAFAIFFFLSLALAKRYAELARAASEQADALPRRGYLIEDLGLIQSVGPASGYMAVLTLCLYINANDVLRLYHTPDLLWVMCLILFYWITRVWFLARRRVLHEDPVIFAIKDPVSYAAGLGMLGILIAAAA